MEGAEFCSGSIRPKIGACRKGIRHYKAPPTSTLFCTSWDAPLRVVRYASADTKTHASRNKEMAIVYAEGNLGTYPIITTARNRPQPERIDIANRISTDICVKSAMPTMAGVGGKLLRELRPMPLRLEAKRMLLRLFAKLHHRVISTLQLPTLRHRSQVPSRRPSQQH